MILHFRQPTLEATHVWDYSKFVGVKPRLRNSNSSCLRDSCWLSSSPLLITLASWKSTLGILKVIVICEQDGGLPINWLEDCSTSLSWDGRRQVTCQPGCDNRWKRCNLANSSPKVPMGPSQRVYHSSHLLPYLLIITGPTFRLLLPLITVVIMM